MTMSMTFFFFHRPLFRNGWTVSRSVRKKKQRRKENVITWEWYQAVQAEKQVLSSEIREFILHQHAEKATTELLVQYKTTAFFPGCDESCQKECLDAHNRYRVNHGASPLVLDQKLANQAQQWADKKVFKHSPWAGGQGGETIALGSLYPSFTAAVKAWHDEEKDYDWSTGEGLGGMKVNHFTQVCKGTLRVCILTKPGNCSMQG